MLMCVVLCCVDVWMIVMMLFEYIELCMCVEIYGIKVKFELNGCVGMVMEYVLVCVRYCVCVSDGDDGVMMGGGKMEEVYLKLDNVWKVEMKVKVMMMKVMKEVEVEVESTRSTETTTRDEVAMMFEKSVDEILMM